MTPRAAIAQRGLQVPSINLPQADSYGRFQVAWGVGGVFHKPHASRGDSAVASPVEAKRGFR